MCDGAKPNRKFLTSLGIKEHMKNGTVYKTINHYSHDRFIYFISDVTHLIKTTRNCWFSYDFGGVRCMWVSSALLFRLFVLLEQWQAYSVGAPEDTV